MTGIEPPDNWDWKRWVPALLLVVWLAYEFGHARGYSWGHWSARYDQSEAKWSWVDVELACREDRMCMLSAYSFMHKHNMFRSADAFAEGFFRDEGRNRP